MEDYDIKSIVDSLFSENVNEEYLNLYLNNFDLKKECNSMISKLLSEEFSNNVYDVDKCLRFLNNVVSKELYSKPYMLELNVIVNTINSNIERIKDTRYFADEKGKKRLDKENAKLYSMLFIISDEFSLKHDINFDAEKEMSKYYIDKISNNIPLSKGEVEELISFTLTYGFLPYQEKSYSRIAFDYALKNVLENDYEIEPFLYKKLFYYVCKEELDKEHIQDMTFVFNHDKGLNYGMLFNSNNSVVLINNDYFLKNSMLKNLISFFHEFRHYEQANKRMPINLVTLLSAKDKYLSNVLRDDDYYNKNYSALFNEKDANASSYKSIYDFVKEKAPNCLPKLKDEIYKQLSSSVVPMFLGEYKRKVNMKDHTEYEDIDVLFEKTVRERHDLLSKVFLSQIDSVLLIEYDLSGKKRNIFELLKEKEAYIKGGFRADEVKILNYLLYEENVSLEYILENLKLLGSKENKEQYKNYYQEARKVLKQKLILYYMNRLNKKSNNALHEDKILLSVFYDEVIEGIKKMNILRLSKDKNIELYRKKEAELIEIYKWLYDLISEIENEHVEEVEKGRTR